MAQNNSLGGLSQMSELKSRLLFLLGALIIFRLGAHIPVPGIDPLELKKLFDSQSGGILGMFNMFSGGALSRFTVFALGINEDSLTKIGRNFSQSSFGVRVESTLDGASPNALNTFYQTLS